MSVYQLSFEHVDQGMINVTLRLKPKAAQTTLEMPSWTPGSYKLRHYAKHVHSLNALTEKGKSVSVVRAGLSEWLLTGYALGETVTISYQVYANDISVRGCYASANKVLIEGAALWLKSTDHANEPHLLEIKSLASLVKGSSVMTGLAPKKVNAIGLGTYQADTYQELIDGPLHIGPQAVAEFVAGDIPHRVAFIGLSKVPEQLPKALQTVCQTILDNFNGEAPFTRYTFLVDIVPGGYGGLEHVNSTRLLFGELGQNWYQSEVTHESAIQFLSLCSHEYLHAWHVKTLTPKSFVSPTLKEPVNTRLLWCFEGFTAYLDMWFVWQSGLITEAQYLTYLSQSLKRLKETPGASVESLGDSAALAWIQLYEPSENTINQSSSYYLKGAWVAQIIDSALKGVGCQLAHIVQDLWMTYGRNRQGITADQIFEALSQYLSVDTVTSLRSLIELDNAPLPIEPAIEAYGWQVSAKAKAYDNCNAKEWLAIDLNGGQGLSIRQVRAFGLAYQAGLRAQDKLLAINGLYVETESQLTTALNLLFDEAKAHPAQTKAKTFTLTVVREGRLREFEASLQLPTITEWSVVSQDESAAHANPSS